MSDETTKNNRWTFCDYVVVIGFVVFITSMFASPFLDELTIGLLLSLGALLISTGGFMARKKLKSDD